MVDSFQHSAFSIQHSAFSIQHSAFSIQHSAFSIQHSVQSIELVIPTGAKRSGGICGSSLTRPPSAAAALHRVPAAIAPERLAFTLSPLALIGNFGFDHLLLMLCSERQFPPLSSLRLARWPAAFSPAVCPSKHGRAHSSLPTAVYAPLQRGIQEHSSGFRTTPTAR